MKWNVAIVCAVAAFLASGFMQTLDASPASWKYPNSDNDGKLDREVKVMITIFDDFDSFLSNVFLKINVIITLSA
jgi:hypothetical protein